MANKKPIFGKRSKASLQGVHPDLVKIHEHVLNVYEYDHSVLSGVRTIKEQKKLFAKGRDEKGNIVSQREVITNCDGIKKKSNHQAKGDGKGHATDSAPYPIDFGNNFKKMVRFYYFGALMKAAAIDLERAGKIKHVLRWGGDWDGDDNFSDQRFDDVGHLELIKP